jgi:hypothetical protein
MSGGPSYRSVHYAQRPAKNVERKMIVDALMRLQRVVDLSKSRYVGLGSVYFTDFILMHKLLGLTDLVSIELTQDAGVKQRFEANKPFDCVDLIFGHTNGVLPRLFTARTGGGHNLVWLDYDKPISKEMLTDVATVVKRTGAFSVLMVTVQADPGRDPEKRVNALIERVGREKVPRHVQTGVDLAGERTAEVSREILTAEVQRTLETRNRPRLRDEHVVAEQIFNFRYADEAPMLTVGWILAPQHDRARVVEMRLDQPDYTRDGADAFEIAVPKLTVRETLDFDRQLPTTIEAFAVPPGLAIADVEAYLSCYRFFPTFVDAAL